MWTAEQLALWGRAVDVLTRAELGQGLEVDYLELFRQMLCRVMERTGEQGREPLVSSRYAAQRMAATVFDFRRQTAGMLVSMERRRSEQLTRAGERTEQFAESELRRKMNNLVLDELDAAERFARAAAGLPEAEVVALPSRGGRRGA
jgi:hypothetical protein